MARPISAAAIMQQARVATDTVGAADPPDSDLLSMLNLEFSDWYELVKTAYGSDYFANQWTFTTVSGQQDYSLPTDFDDILFVDQVVQTSTPPTYRNVDRYDRQLRNVFLPFINPASIPAGQKLRLTYVPICPTLYQYAYLNITTSDGVDTLTFQAQQPGPNGTAVTVAIATGGSAGTAVASASGLAVTITIGTGTLASAVVAAVNGTPTVFNLVQASATQPADTVPYAAVSATALGGVLQYDFFNGWERYLVSGLAARICERLDLDPSAHEQKKATYKQEILTLAENRDSSMAHTVGDIQLARRAMQRSVLLGFFPYTFQYQLLGSGQPAIGVGANYGTPLAGIRLILLGVT